MYKVEAIIQPSKLNEVRDALVKEQITGMTVSQVMGFGTQKGHKEFYRGVEVAATFLPKMKIEVVVSSEDWLKKAVEIITATCKTGKPGDGKIFIYKIDEVIRIRTGDKNAEALN